MSDVRYDFGRQWNEYSDRVSASDISTASSAFKSLLPADFSAEGKSLLDIGCGTGIHAIAAVAAGFQRVVAVDFYRGSVEAAKKMSAKTKAAIEVYQDDILSPKTTGEFDAVYSWGVLHHTGDMALAIKNAASFVKPGGLFIISIYLRTPLCSFWKAEKRLYTRLPRPLQTLMDYSFRGLMHALKAVDGKQEKERGMDWKVGVRDWLGGYPYESATPSEVEAMVGRDFTLTESRNTEPGPGILGTICAEYVFVKRAHDQPTLAE